MPMSPAALKSQMKETIYNALKKNFSASASQGANYDSVADENWKKIADSISEIAFDIVNEITSNAQVMSGIPVATAGSPAAQTGVTTAPGNIF